MPDQENKIKLRTIDGQNFDIPEEGSLGLLALGYNGIMLWREKRRQIQTQRLKEQNAE